MDIEVDDGSAADCAFGAQHANRYGNVIQHTKTSAVIREGVMRAAAEIRRYAISNRSTRRSERATY
jgi:hypothetical protein